MKKLALALITVAVFFFAIGSVGALENNTIGLAQCAIQCLICAGVEALSLKYLEED